MKKFLAFSMLSMVIGFAAGCGGNSDPSAPDEYAPPPVSGEGNAKQQAEEIKNATKPVEPAS